MTFRFPLFSSIVYFLFADIVRSLEAVTEPVYCGFLSKQAAEQYGYCIYLDTRGNPQPITMVHRLPRWKAFLWTWGQYLWPDTQFVGVVSMQMVAAVEGEYKTEYVRTGSRRFGESELEMSMIVPGWPGTLKRFNRSTTSWESMKVAADRWGLKLNPISETANDLLANLNIDLSKFKIRK